MRRPRLRKDKFATDLLISLAIHGLALVVILLRSGWRSEEYGGKPGPAAIEVRLQGVGIGRSGSEAADRGRARSQREKTLDRRLPGPERHARRGKRIDLGLVLGGPRHGAAGPSTRSDGDADGFETANAMDMKEEGELYPFFHVLWRRIDAATGYPDDFAKRRVTGSVTVQLVVDPNELREQRLEMMKEEWERVIRKPGDSM